MKNQRYLRNSPWLKYAALLVTLFLVTPFLMSLFGGADTAGVAFAAAGGLTFIDLAKANSSDVVGGLIEENEKEAPELAIFDSEDMQEPGLLSYETLHRTGLPSVGFAHAGEGFTPTKSEIELKKHECYRFGGRVEAARHIADNWRRGGAAGYQAFEASGVMKAAMLHMGKQIFYGTANDGKGFGGLKAFTPKGSETTFDATGSTADTASSVYFVKFGEAYTRLMIGRARNGSGIFDLPDFRIGDINDPKDANKKIEAYISELSSYVGLQIASKWSILRICNLTAQTGKTLTDAVITQAKRIMPANWTPDVCFMSKRSRGQLQDSRTVTLFGQGSNRPTQGMIAPLPTTDADGVPIVVTDSILNTDAIEA